MPTPPEVLLNIKAWLATPKEQLIDFGSTWPIFQQALKAGIECTGMALEVHENMMRTPFVNKRSECCDYLRRLQKIIETHIQSAAVVVQPKPVGGFASATTLAEERKLPEEACRKALERWRKKHGEGWIANEEHGSTEPCYVYDRNAVKHVLDDLDTRTIRRTKTSGKRPAVRKNKQNSGLIRLAQKISPSSE